MNVLLINAYGNNPSGSASFSSFFSLIKNIYKKVSYKTGIDVINYIYRAANDIDSYIYDNEYEGSGDKEDEQLSHKANFDKLDIIFIDGAEDYLPWKGKGAQLSAFIKQCKIRDKPLFAAGVGLQLVIYYLATGTSSEVHYLNSRGQIEALEEIHLLSEKTLRALKKNDDFLDYVTGDVLEYRSVSKEWIPISNIGLHKHMCAEKYMDRGRFVLPDIKIKENKSTKESLVTNCREIKTYINKQYLSSFLLKDIPTSFTVYSILTWFPHYFNVTFEKYQFSIIGESNKGIMIIEHENTVGVTFHPKASYRESVKILENFIREKFKKFLENTFKFKDEIPFVVEEKLPLMFRAYQINDQIRARQLDDKEKAKSYYPPTSVDKVNASRAFCRVRKVKKDAPHCGFSINPREMVFVENNSINQRPISIFGLHSFPKKQEKKKEQFVLKSNVIHGFNFTDVNKIKPNENAKIAQIFKIEKGEIENIQKEREENKRKKISKTVEDQDILKNLNEVKNLYKDQPEKVIEDYLYFVNKNDMEEEDLYNFYGGVRRNILLKMDELEQIANFRKEEQEFYLKNKTKPSDFQTITKKTKKKLIMPDLYSKRNQKEFNKTTNGFHHIRGNIDDNLAMNKNKIDLRNRIKKKFSLNISNYCYRDIDSSKWITSSGFK